MNHLSDEEIFLYLDKELNQGSVNDFETHIKECKSCREKLNDLTVFSKTLQKSINQHQSRKDEHHLTELEIASYIDNMDTEISEKVEKHIIGCLKCKYLIDQTKMVAKLEEYEEMPEKISQDIFNLIKKEIKNKQEEKVLDALQETIDKSSLTTKSLFNNIKNSLIERIKSAFVFPTPRFAPIFGESETNVLSPYGKVLFPVTFKWNLASDVDKYKISIQEAEWSKNIIGNESEVKIDKSENILEFGRSYYWLIESYKDENIIDEFMGKFSLPTITDRYEVESLLNTFTQDLENENNIFLSAILLELKGFFIDAVNFYVKYYESHPNTEIAYRIAYCYDKLGLVQLREKWNKKIKSED